MSKQLLITFLSIFILSQSHAQQLYYRNPDSTLMRNFTDSLNRIALSNTDSNSLLKYQFNYILKFYPNMLVKNILIETKEAREVVKTRPVFSTILKSPEQRVYKITFSKSTKSTLDSILIDNLSFNSQLGLIAKQIAKIDELSTSGFWDFTAWYFRHLTRRGRNRIEATAEKKTLEIGLGYQLLALNQEIVEKLNIDKWKSVKGYTRYVKYTKNAAMKPNLINDFINDLPVYITKEYN